MKQRTGPFPHGVLVNMTGWRFGRLLVLAKVDNLPDGQPVWLSLCDCGNLHLAVSGNLRNGGTQSCGCLYRETRSTANLKHGLSSHPLYNIWRNMHRQCYDPSSYQYEKYGGRGIGVSEEWHGTPGLIQFVQDMHPKPEGHYLGLIDWDDDFSVANCARVPPRHMSRRRRDNRMITWRGRTLALCEWGEETGISDKTRAYRLKAWGEEDLDRIFLTPLRGGKS